jgi:hypothetical protein
MTNFWVPDSTTIDGWMIETPIRSPDLPVNLWVHWSGISKDWGGFPPALTDGDWHDGSGVLVAPVALGDTVLAAQGAVGLAAAHREETSLFNTDNWGMAVDSVGRLQAPVVGQSSVVLALSLRTLGNCWPVALALTVDMLVLREALVPQTPLPYGQRPKPGRSLRDRIVQRETYLEELRSVSERRKVLKRLLKTLDQEAVEGPPPQLGLPRRATMGLTMSLTAPLAPARRPPEPQKPPPDKPRRRKA